MPAGGGLDWWERKGLRDLGWSLSAEKAERPDPIKKPLPLDEGLDYLQVDLEPDEDLDAEIEAVVWR